MPQAYNLLEQGEAWMISSAISSLALERKEAGAPIDLAAPKEGVFAMPSGVGAGEGRAASRARLRLRQRDARRRAAEQARRGPTFSLPTNKDTPVPAGMPTDVTMFASTGSSSPTTAPTG